MALPGVRTDLPPGVPPNDAMYSPLVVPENIYHADPTSLSSTGGARTLIRQTPKQFYNDRHEPQKPKPEYDFGHCAHKMVLGEGNQFKVMDQKFMVSPRTVSSPKSPQRPACGRPLRRKRGWTV